MLQLPIGKLLSSIEGLSKFAQALESMKSPSEKFGIASHTKLVEEFNIFTDSALTMGFFTTAGIAKKATLRLTSADQVDDSVVLDKDDLEHVRHLLRSVMECLEHEASVAVAIVLTPDNAFLYKAVIPIFGMDVSTKFPSIQYDASEAGKCLALGRSTAAAFHAIRCLEAGIKAISRCLGIPDPTKGADRNWGAMLLKIKHSVDDGWPSSTSRFSGDGATFEGLHAVLSALQNPYRNATMHFDQTYTENDAKHITEMVKGVMHKIASRMDEDGLPLAERNKTP